MLQKGMIAMKKIISGKMYNTETASEVASISSYQSQSDFNWYEEILYKKTTGEYFLWGHGGPMTKYAEACDGGGYTGGSNIFPLSKEEVLEWGEMNMDADKYEAEFGPVAE